MSIAPVVRLAFAVSIAVSLGGCSGRDGAVGQESGNARATADQMESTGPDNDAPDRSEGPTDGDGQMIVTYEDATSPEAQNGKKMMSEAQFLEEMAAETSEMLELPQDIPLIGRQCGEANAYWSPSDTAMTICYEDVDAGFQVFSKAKDPDPVASTLGAERATFYHELGHATIDIYDLPFTGREEDVADQLAAVLLLEPDATGKADPDNVQAAVDWARIWEDSAAQNGSPEDFPFWDAHEYDLARMYNFQCWIYGSNPVDNRFIVDSGTLPEDRAQDCPQEWERMSRAWDEMLDPYWK
ncbi:hypothetical protein JRC04_25590 [Mycolicibacterium sp. S2-37]|uniref:DUF4344 domain-containing metallopeptidase n=1 Tax=Mycolicibacterium sp. S2-37 TaxID=2810297 RepID=UPI001A945498|nr:DUF4344 domain-containing metallopeptidase [Mycolicibacterium sp. S2-37]MBO0680854.1 hypothetical protein [Mycolicibacterium sp. S2-37]